FHSTLTHSLLPPLFPYTTLFRSCHAVARDLGLFCRHSDARQLLPLRFGNFLSSSASPFCGGGLGWGDEVRHLTPHPPLISIRRRDRKSTRLNSSHVAISYAVFCL